MIEPGNSFLAGCGFLGELACDGSRDVGLFWSEALGWRLVWDHDQETAIQSEAGGTKIAWGRPARAPTGPARTGSASTSWSTRPTTMRKYGDSPTWVPGC